MRMIEGFNKTIDYIESVMKDEIDEKRIMELSGYSYAMFRRIFSILTETTLSEYIRARKLTEAAKKIRETDEKIIEIAFEYGYDSPDSIHVGWKYLFEVLFPEQGYRHSGKPDFEVYSEGDMYSETYKMELWVPIVKE